MKTTLTVFILLLATTLAHAGEGLEEIVNDYHFDNDDEISSLRFSVEDVGETAQNPLRLSLRVKCQDHRAKPNSVKPRWTPIFHNLEICHAFKPKWDKNKQVLMVYYSTRPPGEPCGGADHRLTVKQKFEVLEHCGEWQR